MDMHDSAHPGELLQGWIDDLNMSVTAFTEHINISRPMLSRILNAACRHFGRHGHPSR